MTTFVNNFFSIVTIIAQIIIVLSVFAYFWGKGGKLEAFFLEQGKKHGFLVAFIVASLSVIGSLTYSDVLGYTPCVLCWWQRIFMYPLVLLFAMALRRNDKSIRPFAIGMALVGGFIALDHYFLQTTGVSVLPCSAVGYSVSCAKNFVLQYGYITIPLMALSAFGLILVSLLWNKRAERLEK